MRKLLFLSITAVLAVAGDRMNAQCTMTDTAIVTANVRCNGANTGTDSVSAISGTLPYTYMWSDANSQNTATATGLSAGTYSVLVTDNSGCTATAANIIIQPNPLSASATVVTSVSCPGFRNGSAEGFASGGTSPYLYQWNNVNVQTSQTAGGLTAGTYSVTITDSCGAMAVASIVVTQPNPLVDSIVVTNVSCSTASNGSATVIPVGGTYPFTYLWNDGNSQTTAVANGLSAGSYTITVSDSCGGSSTASATVGQPSPLNAITIVIANATCNPTGLDSVFASGGTSPYTYLWNDGSSQTTAIADGLIAGNYTVTVSDSCGSSTTASAVITQPASLNITTSVTGNITCNGASDGSISASASGGVAPYTYSWSPTGGTNVTATGLSAGTYTVTVTDINGCSSTATKVLGQPSLIGFTITDSSNVVVSNDTVCNGAIPMLVYGGTPPYTYLWSGGQTTDSIGGLCSDSIYCLTAKDANGCTASTCVQIIVAGVQNISNASSIKVYPDPNNGYFTIAGVTRGQIIVLYNYMGEKLSSITAGNSSPVYFDISGRANGIYLIRIQTSDGVLVTQKKMIKVQ